jgi:hypothetical protein
MTTEKPIDPGPLASNYLAVRTLQRMYHHRLPRAAHED